MTGNASNKSLVIPNNVPAPLGNYLAVAIRGNQGYVSGQFPIREGVLAFRGRIGEELSVEQGKSAAQLCALNALGQIRKAMNGDLSRIRLCRIEGYIASAPGFIQQPSVLDGASDVFVQLLGEHGLHARTVFPVTHLPSNAAMELAVTFHVVE